MQSIHWTVSVTYRHQSSCGEAYNDHLGKIQDIGLFTETWPTILGFDVAGEIVEVGKDVKGLKKGGRVIS